MGKNKKNQSPTMTELMQTVRGSWNGINPITKVIPNKKKKSKREKHRKRAVEDLTSEL